MKMYNTENVQYESNDIDLFYILRQIVHFFKASFKILATAFVVGVLLGVVHYKITPPVYTSTLIAYSINLPQTKVDELTNELQIMIKERDYQQLANTLKLPLELAEKIKKMEIVHTGNLEERLSEEQSMFMNSFGLEVAVTDQRILEDVKNAFIEFIGNNKFVKKKMELYTTSIEKNLKIVEEEIRYVESMKNNLQAILANNNTKANLFISDIGSLSARLLDLQIAKVNLQNKLELTRTDITVVKDFVKFKKPSSPKLSYSLAGGVTLAMFVTLFVLGLIRLSKI